MKTLLVNSPTTGSEGVLRFMYPPLGLLYLSAYLREKDIELKVIDGSRIAYSALLTEVNSYSPDIIGVSFTTKAAAGAHRFINYIKGKRDIKIAPIIICGCPHPTAKPEDVLIWSNCNVVVIGEDEFTFYENHKMFNRGSSDVSNILGIAYRSGNEMAYKDA